MSDADFTGHHSARDGCGCCEGVSVKSPTVIFNRPGLSAIAYRIGEHGDVLASLLARLSSRDYPALARLRTRDRDDFSIALLDAYAGLTDVLTFYQERIANESYLRTADERFSLQEMARLIGYSLNPGAAAETFLAFTMEEVEGAPEKAKLAAGLQVQSVPGQDEKPQVFETVEEIEARPEWNLLLPRTSEMRPPVFGAGTIYLKGTATPLKAGDTLLFVGSERETDSTSERWNFRRIRELTVDSANDRTVVELERGLGSVSPHVDPPADPDVYVFRSQVALFGHNAPDWRLMPDDIRSDFLRPDSGDAVTDPEWPGFSLGDISDPPEGSAAGTGLFGEYFNDRELAERHLCRLDATVDFTWAAGSPDPSMGADFFSVRWSGWLEAPATGTYTFFTESDDGVRLWVNDVLIIDNWTIHAVHEDSGPISLTGGKKHKIRLEYFENGVYAAIRLYWQPPGQSRQIIPQNRLYPGNILTLHLDNIYPQIVPESWLVLSIPECQELYRVETVAEDSRANFALTGKTSRLELDGENLRECFNDRIRETAVFAQSEKLALAEIPVTGDVSGDSLVLQKKTEGMLPGRRLLFEGETPAGNTVSELAILLKSEPDGAGTKLVFTRSLEYIYKLETVKIYGNVAMATHGKTVHQILGSGAARKAHQRFSLKHGPLTFTRTDNESGTEAALEVRVNDIVWKESPSLYGAGANHRVYTVTVDGEGVGHIQFGDGRRGARLPTGRENIHGVYRNGIGSVGNLQPSQLSQLLSRPLGLKEVTNPQPSSGGVDAETEAEIRRNIPLGVRTLGRAVSLRDFEDYALAYTGIGKAQAKVLDIRGVRTIFLSVAGHEGVQPETASLLQSLKKNSDPFIVCEAAAYNEAFFKLALRVKRHPDHAREKVLADVEAALRKAFSFEVRDFGQIVARSEVIRVVQNVRGVEGVDVDRFYRGILWALEDVLAPAPATVDSNGDGVGAELLLLDPGELDYLEEMV